MSSQQSVLSYFKSVKRRNPDQHAAKKRKVVLQFHEIESLLDSGLDPGLTDNESEEDQSPREDVINEEKEASDEFESDEDWENLANATLDDVEKELLDNVSSQDEIREVTVAVPSWAGDNHWSSLSNNLSSDETPVPVVKTPTTIRMTESVNQRQSKTVERAAQWTPTSVSSPLFTLGLGLDQLPTAKKRLDWSEPENRRRKNVVFTKMSKLSRWRLSSPRKQSYESHNIKLTPQRVMSLPPEPVSAVTKQKNSSVFQFTAGSSSSENTKFHGFSPVCLQSPIKRSAKLGAVVSVKESNVKKLSSAHGVTKNLFSSSPDEKQPVPDLRPAIANAKKLVEKKITPAQIRSRLTNAKLQDLRSLLSGIEGSKLKVLAAGKRPSPVKAHKPDIELDLDVADTRHKSPVKVARTPVKASPRKLPAYQRYHTLSQPVNRTLPLPLAYSRLLEVFRSTDTVVSMMFNKRERITLDRLTRNTTDIMNKKWTVEHLRKMICVFPQSYKLRWRSSRARPELKELVVEPNMNYKRDLMSLFNETQLGEHQMTAATLVERRDMFRNGLLDIVKDYHEEFLASLDPPITADRAKLTRWHKDFDVDVLPDLDMADLPPHPDAQNHQGPDLEDKAEYLKVNPKLSEVLLDINCANKNDHTYPSSPTKTLFSPQNSHSTPVKSGLEGLNPSLVAKIRAKEAAKAKLEMTRSENKLEKIACLRKLPRLARLVK